jgi:hypothetical protein
MILHCSCKVVNMGIEGEVHKKWIEETVDYEFHGVVDTTTLGLDYVNSLYTTGMSSLRMMNQKTGNLPMSFMMKRKHFLIKTYNEIILRLRDAGITEFLNNWRKRKGEKIDEYGPQVLDLEHLDVCFLVCMIPLVLAFAVFIFEHLWQRLQKKLSECFKKNETAMLAATKFPKIIQVQPRVQRRFSACLAYELSFPSNIQVQRKFSV